MRRRDQAEKVPLTVLETILIRRDNVPAGEFSQRMGRVVTASDLAQVAERDAERAARQLEQDREDGMVTDDCPPAATLCELCHGREGVVRQVAEAHYDGTTRGPVCYSVCRACTDAEQGPEFDTKDWFGQSGYKRRLADHREHLGWTANDEDAVADLRDVPQRPRHVDPDDEE